MPMINLSMINNTHPLSSNNHHPLPSTTPTAACCQHPLPLSSTIDLTQFTAHNHPVHTTNNLAMPCYQASTWVNMPHHLDSDNTCNMPPPTAPHQWQWQLPHHYEYPWTKMTTHQWKQMPYNESKCPPIKITTHQWKQTPTHKNNNCLQDNCPQTMASTHEWTLVMMIPCQWTSFLPLPPSLSPTPSLLHHSPPLPPSCSSLHTIPSNIECNKIKLCSPI